MSAIVLATGQGRIPGWVKDLRSFRRWAHSEDFPRCGWFSFLNGDLWVDTSMEQLITHNRVKTEYTVVLGGLVKEEDLGYFFTDRALLTNWRANLSTEPDGLFVSFAAIEKRLAEMVVRRVQGYVELSGTPDMVLEIVSNYSVRKDTVVLRELYWQAGIPEYWLVDARQEPHHFDILRRGSRGYVKTRAHEGWIKSQVFGRSFRLEAHPDRLGNTQFALMMR